MACMLNGTASNFKVRKHFRYAGRGCWVGFMLSVDGGGSDSAGKFERTCYDNNRQ